jgi:hypothetical protein
MSRPPGLSLLLALRRRSPASLAVAPASGILAIKAGTRSACLCPPRAPENHRPR